MHFQDVRNLDMHLYKKHDKEEKREEAFSALSCRFCHESFRHLQQRVDHEDRHSDDLKYNCQACGKGFRLLSSLKSHISRSGKRHNPEAREFNCDSCDRVFSSVASKQRHNR